MHDCSCEGIHEFEELMFKSSFYATIISIVAIFIVMFFGLGFLFSYVIIILIISFFIFVVMLGRRYFLF